MLNAARSLDDDATFIADLRRREFARLDRNGDVYVDYTGSALYAESQLDAHTALLRDRILGNPHSEHAASRASTDLVEEARREVLRFFDTDAGQHTVCFTANTTAAIKLVAEGYPFDRDTPLVLSIDNHNSVNGIREFARRAGAPVAYLPIDRLLRLHEPSFVLRRERRRGQGLLAFPAQSNFSGVRHPLSLIDEAHALGYRVLLDAAAWVPSCALSLRECRADFVALSFYKMFGYPTGVGALIARRDALASLRRPWFSGGTVRFASIQAATHQLRPGHEAFEDGTPDFLGIAAVPAGLALLDAAGMDRLSEHVARLTATFLEAITPLRHRNGVSVVQIHGPRTMKDRGGAVALNVRGRTGQVVPYWTVEERARKERIALRGGCFCNPGASEVALGLDGRQTAECLASLAGDFTPERFAVCSGSPVGAIRVSFGLANNDEDVRRVVSFLGSFAD